MKKTFAMVLVVAMALTLATVPVWAGVIEKASNGKTLAWLSLESDNSTTLHVRKANGGQWAHSFGLDGPKYLQFFDSRTLIAGSGPTLYRFDVLLGSSSLKEIGMQGAAKVFPFHELHERRMFLVSGVEVFLVTSGLWGHVEKTVQSVNIRTGVVGARGFFPSASSIYLGKIWNIWSTMPQPVMVVTASDGVTKVFDGNGNNGVILDTFQLPPRSEVVYALYKEEEGKKDIRYVGKKNQSWTPPAE